MDHRDHPALCKGGTHDGINSTDFDEKWTIRKPSPSSTHPAHPRRPKHPNEAAIDVKSVKMLNSIAPRTEETAARLNRPVRRPFESRRRRAFVATTRASN